MKKDYEMELAKIADVAKQEGGKDTLTAMRNEYAREIEGLNTALTDLIHQKEQYDELWAIDEESFQLRLKGDGLRVINPTYRFQETDEWFELQKRQTEKQFKAEKDKVERQYKDFKRQVEATEEQIAQITACIEKVDQELGESQ